MTAHRYWRINVTAAQSGTQVSILRLELHSVAGGPNVASISGNWSASSQFTNGGGYTYNAHNVIDGATDNDMWAPVNGVPAWIRYDAGAGSALVVSEIKMTARNDGGFWTQSPHTFGVQFSDDNSNWTSWLANTSNTAATWTQRSVQTFADQSQEWSETAMSGKSGLPFWPGNNLKTPPTRYTTDTAFSSTPARVNQVVREVLRDAQAPVRVAQVVREVLRDAQAPLRVAQVVREVLVSPAQQPIEYHVKPMGPPFQPGFRPGGRRRTDLASASSVRSGDTELMMFVIM
jgi:hypothetical protein